MQWAPTRPGWNFWKFHLVAAAASTSPVSMPNRSNDLDRGRAVNTGLDHRAVDVGDDLQGRKRPPRAGQHSQARLRRFCVDAPRILLNLNTLKIFTSACLRGIRETVMADGQHSMRVSGMHWRDRALYRMTSIKSKVAALKSSCIHKP